MNARTENQREGQAKEPEAVLIPAVDVFEDPNGITLYADLPGVARENLLIEVEGDTLTLAGELTLNAPEGMAASHAEVDLPRYRRVFTLSKELDPNQVDADFKQGVLRLRIPKLEHAQARRIEIRVA